MHSFGRELANLDEIKAKRLDFRQDAMERCTVQVTGEHRFRAFVAGPQRRKS
jgi:tRNA U38,U39,U40 pseudouridine synthase TruA